eukprot:180977-Chlamydomonas_euryale.AAC.2
MRWRRHAVTWQTQAQARTNTWLLGWHCPDYSGAGSTTGAFSRACVLVGVNTACMLAGASTALSASAILC